MIQKISSTSEFSKTSGVGEIDVRHWTEKEAKNRALKWALACFGLACASVFLPVAHFFLVPGFLIAIPFIFRFILKQRATLIGGNVSCPCCQSEIVLSRGPLRLPMTETCSQCRKQVLLNLKTQ